ncbi:hypothetical protein TVAG_227160 [Trichomonas vaginalis G3]|uniref:Uncharacterized protein n=1 Tax=Trichomonas vaginalis (strain ATCC PRA-98 / G3) TaxID=412133 RepID=A2FFW0_TRIV3|nr:hypothetical protein TVAGG3_0803050 [Trichomonas vaginalis G3]EAX96221.1 hypothetical protein TVAG_227160 [Trichomonas vaginalis G3]KAI5496646.1 hypothetical protein TVAGG3_0803050 [Trichomonas vaginalis G3]|eukprot:XP_001309151.1 hypothetical protein [Trichomonas vaginalis G3]
MLLNSNGIINSLLLGWEAHLNSDRLHQIEKDFACCGFHFRYQFFGDKCNISEWPCLLPMANKLMPSVVKSGYYFLAQAIFHLCATICYFLLARKETIITEEAESFLKPNTNQNIDRFN